MFLREHGACGGSDVMPAFSRTWRHSARVIGWRVIAGLPWPTKCVARMILSTASSCGSERSSSRFMPRKSWARCSERDLAGGSSTTGSAAGGGGGGGSAWDRTAGGARRTGAGAGCDSAWISAGDERDRQPAIRPAQQTTNNPAVRQAACTRSSSRISLFIGRVGSVVTTSTVHAHHERAVSRVRAWQASRGACSARHASPGDDGHGWPFPLSFAAMGASSVVYRAAARIVRQGVIEGSDLWPVLVMAIVLAIPVGNGGFAIEKTAAAAGAIFFRD